MPVSEPVPSLQHFGNVNGVVGGVSQPSVQAPVEAPVKGSLQGTQYAPPVQVDATRVPDATSFCTDGRHSDRQRPGAPLPGNGSHDVGMKLSPVEMMVSGVQKPVPQWAPEQPPPSHAGSVVGSSTGGPVHGQLMIVGGCAGLSHPRLHAPVGVRGFAATGL